MQIMEYNGPGIYAVRNLLNGKRCVGSSLQCRSRTKGHIYGLEKGKHPNKHLQASWIKYGSETFVFEMLEECEPDRTTLLRKEMEWVLKLKTDQAQFGYNKAYPYRQIRPSAWMSARHKEYWESLTEEELAERVAHFSTIEFQERATEGKRKPAHRARTSKQVTDEWAKEGEFATVVRAALRKRLAEQWADPERKVPIGAKISKKAKKRWTGGEYRERGLKQLGEASEKAAKLLHEEPQRMAERQALLSAIRPNAAKGIKARWADPEFRARRIAQLKLPRKRKKK